MVWYFRLEPFYIELFFFPHKKPMFYPQIQLQKKQKRLASYRGSRCWRIMWRTSVILLPTRRSFLLIILGQKMLWVASGWGVTHPFPRTISVLPINSSALGNNGKTDSNLGYALNAHIIVDELKWIKNLGTRFLCFRLSWMLKCGNELFVSPTFCCSS